MYEVVWTRKLTAAFGSTAFAVSFSLASYLVGLAFGGYVFGRLAGRFQWGIGCYAILELLIGAYGLASLRLIDLADRFYHAVGGDLPQSLLPLVQVVAILLTLAPATALMGGTLPVLVAALPERYRTGSLVGRLYGANTAGAVIGCASAGFVLLPAVGMSNSVMAAAVLNIAIGLAAFALVMRPSWHARNTAVDEEAETTLSSRLGLVTRVVASLVSGFCVFFYEVIWTRSLELVLGNSTQAFSLMLVTVLVGLAAGAAAIGRWLRHHDSSVALLALVQAATAITVCASAALMPQSTHWFLELHERAAGSMMLLLIGKIMICAGILLVPSILLGLSFPLIVDLTVEHKESGAKRTGSVYAMSTVGCILGALSGGIVLIPILGLSNSLVLGACIHLGLAAFLARDMALPAIKRSIAAAGSVVLAFLLVMTAPDWDPKLMTSGVFMNARVIRNMGFDRHRAQSELLYFREGRTATVDVKRTPTSIVLSIDGRPEGNTLAVAQVLLGHVPFLFDRVISDVFVVGFGTGSTVGAAALHPVRQVTVAELEPLVFAASSHFEDINHRPLQNPVVRPVAEDARHLLAADSSPSYDLILSQPSNPWVSGSAKLFTLEFYRQSRMRLRSGGIFAQWVQLYNLELKSVRSLLATFREVFPEVLVMEVGGHSGEVLLFGSDRPMMIEWDRVQNIFLSSDTAIDLARVRVSSPASLLARVLLGTGELPDCAAGPLNTDDNGLLEFASLHSLYVDTTQSNIRYLQQRSSRPLQHLAGGPRGSERRRLLLDMASAAQTELSGDRAVAFAAEAAKVDGAPEPHP